MLLSPHAEERALARAQDVRREIRQITELFLDRMHIYEICRPSYDAIYDFEAKDLDIVRAALWSMLNRTYTQDDIAAAFGAEFHGVETWIEIWDGTLARRVPEVVAMQRVLDVFSDYIAEGQKK